MDEAPAASTALVPLRRDWPRALRALVRLARKTDDTSQVFEIIHSLEGDTLERSMARMQASESGRSLLQRRSLLNPLLKDRARLAQLPEGTLGRAYLAFMERSEITADGLDDARDVAAAHDADERQLPPEYEYLGYRFVEQHDLWHVLSGYDSDDTGELANLWFSYGQFGQLGMGFIAFLGTLDGPWKLSWWRYMLRAYRRGRRARFLVAEPLEEMLELPLPEVRSRLNINPPAQAHPRGLFAGDRRADGIGSRRVPAT